MPNAALKRRPTTLDGSNSENAGSTLRRECLQNFPARANRNRTRLSFTGFSNSMDRVIHSVITRRSFLKQSTFLAAGAFLDGQLTNSMRHHPVAQQQTAFNTSKLGKWVASLPIPAVAQAQGKRRSPYDQRLMVPYYRMSLSPADIKVHRDMKPTRWWACASSVPGATIEARSGEPLLVEWANGLPQQHFLPIDPGEWQAVPVLRGGAPQISFPPPQRLE